MPITVAARRKDLAQLGIPPLEMVWWLKMDAVPRVYCCPSCGRKLFRSHYRVIAMIYGHTTAEDILLPPISIDCPNPTCLMRIDLLGFSE